MVKLRLQRFGTKNLPVYRIVATDKRSPRDGDFIEIIGQYNPLSAKEQYAVKEDKAMDWLKKGAVPTDTVKDILKKTGIWNKFNETKPKKTATKKAEK